MSPPSPLPWPWVMLARVPRLLPRYGPRLFARDAAAEEAAELPPDFTLPLEGLPMVPGIAPIAHPDPNYPDRYPYLLAAGPSCLLFNFAVEPFYGVNSDVGPKPNQTYLMVAREFSTVTIGPGRRELTADFERIPRRDGRMQPVSYSVDCVGLLSYFDGNYLIGELRVARGGERAKLFRFRSDDPRRRWIQSNLACPLPAQDREWVYNGVAAHDNKLWWFDLSWGILACDPFVQDPVLVFHGLPEGRALDASRPDTHNHRWITVSNFQLRYVEIIPEDGNERDAATVSMWTWIPATGGEAARWDKTYEMSFAELWKHDTYKKTRLLEKVPALSVVTPWTPDAVCFDLQRHIFIVNMAERKVQRFFREVHEMVNMPWPARASNKYVCAWNLPPSVAIALNLVSTTPDQQVRTSSSLNLRPEKRQREDSPEDEGTSSTGSNQSPSKSPVTSSHSRKSASGIDDDEAVVDEFFEHLGMEQLVALKMSPAELKAAVDMFLRVQDHPSSEWQVMRQMHEEEKKHFDFLMAKEQGMAAVATVMIRGIGSG
ncbi:hypothetical protein ACP4OV_001362 [Aristida adscensionis]